MTLFEKSQKSQTLTGLRVGVGRMFAGLGLSPNQWTMLSLVVALVAAYFILKSMFVLGAVFILVSGFIDVIDGSVARYTGRVTKTGAYIDTVADRYAEFIYVLPLFALALPAVLLPTEVWLALFMFGSMTTTYVKAAAKEKELGIEEIRGGVLERAERVGLYVVGLLLTVVDVRYLPISIAVLAVLANVSALQRISKVLSLVGRKGKE
jgi:phosphatidylglycerophosphate synthase